ncbi:MAG TPA: tetratricopeptide repeat protein [Planctomycetota bacterium]|nr:tetratricopeptide repeat protein [Planctomycetota bacterium]
MIRSRLAYALALPLAACSGAAPAPQETAAPTAHAAADESVDAGTLTERARALVASGQPYEALGLLDEAQAAAPEDADVWYARGRAAQAAGDLGQSAMDFYIDALGAFERAAELGYGADAYLGASRAARMALQSERALELARAGEAAAGDPSTLELPLERTLLEALFGVYVERRQAQTDATEQFLELEDRLSSATARDPGDAWVWTQLANLYQWEGRSEAALEPAVRVLDLTPDDSTAHERAVGLARAAGGRDAVLAMYDEFDAAHPDNALSAWYQAAERFGKAVADLQASRPSIEGFEAARAQFARCRELEPSYEANARGYEVMCQNGVGWALYGERDLEGALEAFLATEQILEGGLEWQIEGQLSSALLGLQFVADQFVQSGEGEFDLTGKVEAAEIFDLLREYKPDDPDFANNAGFFHRDACVILELLAQSAERHARGEKLVRREPAGDIENASFETVQVEVGEEERAAALRDAEELRVKAKAHARKSEAAYLSAAALAPEDVRVQNDAAVVMVYHTRRDVPATRALLERAIELGQRQVQDPEHSAEDLDRLLEAWGDAYQNLGLLELTLADDPPAARAAFERAFEIGPRPRIDRAWVENVALPVCERVAAGEAGAMAELDPRLWLHVQP